MAINFPTAPALNDQYTDANGVIWLCTMAVSNGDPDNAWARVGQSQDIVVPSNKNYIINPTFLINQRGFAGGAIGLNSYSFDRWKANNVGVSATLPDVNGFITISGASGAVGLQYPMADEGFDKQVTLSWEGSAQVIYYRANGSVWTEQLSSPVTLTLASGTSSFAKEYFTFGNGTLKNVKLELGNTPTPFEYPDIASELAKCQRFFLRVDGGQGAMSTSGGGRSVGEFCFPVTMRAIPAISAWYFDSLNYYNSGGDSSATVHQPSTTNPNKTVLFSERLTAVGREVNYYTNFSCNLSAEL